MMQPAAPFDRLDRIGPYFSLSPAVGTGAVGWTPVAALIADDAAGGELVDDVIGSVARGLRTEQRWLAASIFYQGWASRLTSIYAGCMVLGTVLGADGPESVAVPDLAADRLSYRWPTSGPVELALDSVGSVVSSVGSAGLTVSGSVVASPAVMAGPVGSAVVVGWEAAWARIMAAHLDPLADAVRRRVRIGRRLLEGNIAAAMAGSLGALDRAGYGSLDHLVRQAWSQPADLLPFGCWADTADGPRYTRTTCCGYVQLPGAGRCGDCSLNGRIQPAGLSSR
jgi:hypothetical protein